jgi:hypothetical protein
MWCSMPKPHQKANSKSELKPLCTPCSAEASPPSSGPSPRCASCWPATLTPRSTSPRCQVCGQLLARARNTENSAATPIRRRSGPVQGGPRSIHHLRAQPERPSLHDLDRESLRHPNHHAHLGEGQEMRERLSRRSARAHQHTNLSGKKKPTETGWLFGKWWRIVDHVLTGLPSL